MGRKVSKAKEIIGYKLQPLYIYEGETIGENNKSIAFKITFEDYNKTLTDEEVMPIFNKIIESVENKFDAKLRSM